ncbi:MAG: ATP-dependent DNA ligase [Aigarchaeota archaeon]|nr:ATP-dependent DNA ligase [Candidatus Calditenuaceae archaeon]
MDFSRLVSFYERLEATTKRLEMRDILVELFRESEPGEAGKIAYLTLGELYPPHTGVELGMAEKLAIRALRLVSGVDEQRVEELLRKTGDLGLVAEQLLSSKKTQMTLSLEELTVEKVYGQLERIARFAGEGAMEMKVKTLSGLLAQASPKEAKYLIRLVTGKMRLGVADMTIIDALAAMSGGGKEEIERAYNLCSDIGLVASTVKSAGVEGASRIGMRFGIPVRPMLAERLTSAEEILGKLDGTGFAEYKYDGERMQIHKQNSHVLIFSRRQENITSQFPDVVEMCRRGLKAREAIAECEAVAYDPDTGDMLPFQELMHRRRKYDIEKAAQLYPVSLFFFDALYVDGQPLIDLPLLERRKMLESILEPSENFRLTEGIVVSDSENLDKFMLKAVEAGCEGVIVKDISPKSVYRAGARGWLWIKYKRSYVSKLTDTLDLVVVGAFYGKGKRSGKIGTLLMAAYDEDADVFKTVCKVGTGFKDEDLEHLTETLTPIALSRKPARVESIMEPDIWVRPEMVLEIVGDEITLSPIHTCGWGAIRQDAGLAVRFPRFTGRYREDKTPEDATTVKEIMEMYKSQLKVIASGEESEAA